MKKDKATADNRYIWLGLTPSPKFLASLRTSDILKTLGEIMLGCLEHEKTM